jgi:APA family basic amino acid/polyamine antiporter
MSADGLLFRFTSRLHPTYRTPAGGIAIQAVWAVILALSGSYGQLLDYVVFGDWIFFGLIVATLFAYRRRDAASGVTPNVYRMPGYPVLPALFVIIAAYVVVSAIWSNPRNALLGALLIGLGVPAFLFWRRQKRVGAEVVA